MKKFMIAGGLLGFAIGLVFGYVQNSSWPLMIWRASVASVCGGLLLRWWARVWVNSLHEIYQQKLAAEAKLAEAASAGLPSKS
ncbi:MAG: hypothetical protein U1G07_01535 [Verrucomicrobiota bacterium]